MAMPPEAHDVGVDPLAVHDDKADEHAHGKGEDGHQGAAEVKEKNDAHDGHDDAFLDQGSLEVVNGAHDKPGPVVDRFDREPLREGLT